MEAAESIVYPYIPNSEPTVKEQMLRTVGAKSVDELYEDVPEQLRLKERMNLPQPFLSEYALKRHVEGVMVAQNLAAVAEIARTVVQPHAVALRTTDHKSVQVPVAVQVAQRHARAAVVAQSLTAIAEHAAAVIHPHSVGYGIVRDKGVQVAIAVHVAQGHIQAAVIAEDLTAVAEVA